MKHDVIYVLYRTHMVSGARQFVSQYPQYNMARKDGESFKAPWGWYCERQPQLQGVVV
jgi:hypothetical protein